MHTVLVSWWIHVLWMRVSACCVKISVSVCAHYFSIESLILKRWDGFFFFPESFHSVEIVCLSELKTIGMNLIESKATGMGQYCKWMLYCASFRSIWICVFNWSLKGKTSSFLPSSKVSAWCDCFELRSPGATVFIWSLANMLIISNQRQDWFSWKPG